MLTRSTSGVRAVALYEAVKGCLVLLAGACVLALLHGDAQRLAETLVTHLHLNPASHYPRIFLDLADHLTGTRLWLLASFACLYSGLRFIEAYGLWQRRSWAEWFAALSGAVYLPFEVSALIQGNSGLNWVILIINLSIVGYMSYVLQVHYRNPR